MICSTIVCKIYLVFCIALKPWDHCQNNAALNTMGSLETPSIDFVALLCILWYSVRFKSPVLIKQIERLGHSESNESSPAFFWWCFRDHFAIQKLRFCRFVCRFYLFFFKLHLQTLYLELRSYSFKFSSKLAAILAWYSLSDQGNSMALLGIIIDAEKRSELSSS